jgi:hypothetical protein
VLGVAIYLPSLVPERPAFHLKGSVITGDFIFYAAAKTQLAPAALPVRLKSMSDWDPGTDLEANHTRVARRTFDVCPFLHFTASLPPGQKQR